MPTITSRRTGPAARRQRRRARQRQKAMSVAFPHRQRIHRRSVPKRQLREQSADVDDCFEDCQELGYHLDPDVYVGSFTQPGNPFSVLDFDYSNYSTPDPIPTPYQDHTIRPPNPFLAELEWQVEKNSYRKLEEIEKAVVARAEEPEKPLECRSRFWGHSHVQIDDLEANRSSISQAPAPTLQAQSAIPPSVQTSSVPTTPPRRADVQLPGSFPLDTSSRPTFRPSKKRKLNDSPPPPYSTAYRIPSPLLYHKSSHDTPMDTDDEENTCTCLGPTFDHVKDEYRSSCDSGRLSSCNHQPLTNQDADETLPLLDNQHRFVAAALPNMGTTTTHSPLEQAIFHSDPDFYTNTRPYLSPRKSPTISEYATGNSTLEAGKSLVSLDKAKSFTSYTCAGEDLRSTDILFSASAISTPVVSINEKPSALQISRPLHCGHDLIFPQLPSSGVFGDRSLGCNFERTINFWSKTLVADEHRKVEDVTFNKDTVDYVPEKPTKFQKLWSAYERAILGPEKQDSASAKTFLMLSDPHCTLSDLRTLPIVGSTISDDGSTLFSTPFTSIRTSPMDLSISKNVKIPASFYSRNQAAISANVYERQCLGLANRTKTDMWKPEQRPLLHTKAVFEEIKVTESHGKTQQAVDWLMEGLNLEKMFGDDDDQEEDRTYLPWLQAGWDGHMFYSEAATLEIPLPFRSLIEDAEASDEGQSDDSNSWGGMQVNEDAEEDTWWDWDDDASAWSEPSDDGSFDFDL